MMNHVIKIGLIGLGGMSNHHLRLLSELDSAKVTAICDVNGEIVQSVGQKFGIPADKRFINYESLIQDLDVDAVISIVPNKFHAEVIKCCMTYGKPIMTEKPFTVTFEEAEELEQLYKENPIPCMVGFSYRYIPSFRYVKDLLKENKLGKIRHISVQYLQQWGSPLFEVGYNWRFSKDISGSGALGDLGAHMIDSVRYLIGEFHAVNSMMTTFIKERKIENETREVDVDDFTSFQAIIENNIMGTFVTSRNAIGSSNQLEVTVFGDYGTAKVCCEQPNEVTICIKSESNKDDGFQKVDVPSSYEINQLKDFIDFIQGKPTAYTPSFYDGFQNQKIIESIIESAKTGTTITIM